MGQITLVRSRYASNFLTVAKAHSIPVERHLQHCGLTAKILENKNNMITEHQLWVFIAGLAKSSGFTGIGLDAAQVINVEDHGSLSELIRQQSLMLRLSTFCRMATLEYSAKVFTVRKTLGGVLFCRAKVFGDPWQVQQVELYAFQLMLGTIRMDLGQNWFPRIVQFQSNCADEITEAFAPDNVHARFEQDETSIFVSNKELAQTGLRLGAAPESAQSTSPSTTAREFTANVISNYLGDTRLSLTFVSQLSGLHEREIQRLLKAENTSFSELLRDQRVGASTHALNDISIPISEISRTLGYSNPAHFTRAFVRAVGLTPSQYRDSIVN